MPVLKQALLGSALDLYEKSSFEVRELGSKLPDSDVESIVHEVLSRVKAQALRNNKSIDAPTRGKVERLCYALISDDHQEGQRFIESVYEDGASL